MNRPADASDWDESEDSGSDMNGQRLNKDWPGLDNSLCFHLLLIYLPLGFVCGHFTGGSWDIHTGPNLQKTIYLPPFIFHVFFFFYILLFMFQVNSVFVFQCKKMNDSSVMPVFIRTVEIPVEIIS